MEDIRIGVYICHCGKNIAGTIDVEEVKKYVASLPNVAVARDYVYMCSSMGQNIIKEDIKRLGINRVVVAACSPVLHEETFRRALEEAGLNKYLLEMANIREKCSWVHDDRRATTEKAKRIIAMAVEKARYLEPLTPLSKKIVRRVLVIGGGIAGIHASIELSRAGYEVVLVERSPTIGGKMLFFDKTFPTLDCAQCILAPKISEVAKSPNVRILTNAEVLSVDGSVGDFHVRILIKPRYVDPDRCVACGRCSEVCPVETENEWWLGLGKRKAIYIPFPQAYPTSYIIDPSKCLRLRFGGNVCGKCLDACDRGAIDFGMKARVLEERFGAILVAVGGEVFDPSIIEEYGFGRFRNVITGMQFEVMLNVSGPTGGNIIRPSDGKKPRTIVFIQCIGFRSERYNEYCCRTGCAASIKHAVLAKERLGDVKVYVCGIDIRAFGKGYEEFYKRAREEGIVFVSGIPSELKEEEDGRIIVDVYDATLDKVLRILADLVVLSSGLCAGENHKRLSEILRIPRTPDGFFMEKHPKLAPYETPILGIFLAGVAQGPKDIPDTVAQAGGAAAGIMRLLSKDEIELEPTIARVDESLCSGCGICRFVCPYGAVELTGNPRVARIFEGACWGCGVCVSSCPTGAISLPNMGDIHIMAQLKAALRGVRDG